MSQEPPEEAGPEPAQEATDRAKKPWSRKVWKVILWTLYTILVAALGGIIGNVTSTKIVRHSERADQARKAEEKANQQVNQYDNEMRTRLEILKKDLADLGYPNISGWKNSDPLMQRFWKFRSPRTPGSNTVEGESTSKIIEHLRWLLQQEDGEKLRKAALVTQSFDDLMISPAPHIREGSWAVSIDYRDKVWNVRDSQSGKTQLLAEALADLFSPRWGVKLDSTEAKPQKEAPK